MGGYGVLMSNASDEPETGITNEQLPEDLQPTDDNPLAQPLDDDVDPDDLPDGKLGDAAEGSEDGPAGDEGNDAAEK
jgi:hypothetical protein